MSRSKPPNLEKRGRKMERRQPQARAAVSTPGPRGERNMAASLGRQRRSTPLSREGRIRLRTEWNGNGDGRTTCTTTVATLPEIFRRHLK